MRTSAVAEPPDLDALVRRWVAAGIITPEQAQRIAMDQGVQPSPRRRTRDAMPLVIEALAYLGGVVILVAAGLLTGLYWSELGTGGRLALSGAAALALLVAGMAVPERLGGPAVRLSAVLWLLSTGATALFLALLGDETFGWKSEDVTLFAAAGTAAYAGALWWRHRTIAQQLGLFVALAVTAGALADHLGDATALPGIGVWILGLVWFILGWTNLLGPRQLVWTSAALAMLIGAVFTMETDFGIAFALTTLTLLTVGAVMLRELQLLAVAALGALLVLPRAVNAWFPGELAAPIALLVVGGVLVVAALFTARRRPSSNMYRSADGHGRPKKFGGSQ